MRTVLAEDFSDNHRGWTNVPRVGAWLEGGAYRLATREPGRFVAARAPLSGSLRDLAVSGTFRKLAGPSGGGYGLAIRAQGPSGAGLLEQQEHFYVCEVSDRGEVGAWRRDADRWVDLLPWTHSDAVRPGQATNELTVVASGDRLAFLVNDRLVANLTVSGLQEGGVGLFVGGDQNEVAVERFSIETTEAAAASLPLAAPPSPTVVVAQPTAAATVTVATATQAAVATSMTTVPSAPPGPPGPAAAGTPAGEPLLAEGFGDNRRGWPDDPQGPARLVGGTYRLAAPGPGRFAAVLAPLPSPPRDLTVSATFRKAGGPPGGGYGLVVRAGGPPGPRALGQDEPFYVFEVGDRGEVGAWRREPGRWVDLLPWTAAAAARPGAEPNELAVTAVGDRFTFRVNGAVVAELADAALPEGGVGLFVGGDGNQAEALRFELRPVP